MQNPTDLNQAIDALKREMDRVIKDIKEREDQIKEIEAKNNAINMEIKTEDALIRQKQQEILHLQQDMENKKRELALALRNEATVKHDVERFKLEQMQNTNKVGNLTREQKQALDQQKLKH